MKPKSDWDKWVEKNKKTLIGFNMFSDRELMELLMEYYYWKEIGTKVNPDLSREPDQFLKEWKKRRRLKELKEMRNNG